MSEKDTETVQQIVISDTCSSAEVTAVTHKNLKKHPDETNNKNYIQDSAQSTSKEENINYDMSMSEVYYACITCHIYILRWSQLIEHTTKTHGFNPNVCRTCHENYDKIGGKLSHLCVNIPDRARYLCFFCDKDYIVKESLKHHIDTRHPERKIFKIRREKIQ